MIAAILSGPTYDSINHDESTIEVFNHMGEAVDALYERMNACGIYPCTVRTLDGRIEQVTFPTFGQGMRFTCFKASVMASLSDGIPEDVVMEFLPAVHGGHWDYDVELVQGPEDLIVAQVERAGMS